MLQGDLKHYNAPLFHYIGLKYDLTIGYIKKIETKPTSFKVKKIKSIKILGIYFSSIKFYRYLKKYDVIIIMPDLHYFNYCLIPFLFRKKRILSWSIGMRASYRILYDVNRKKKLLDYIFLSILKLCKANIFYYKHPIYFWNGLLDNKKIFVANNTVDVIKMNPQKSKKNTILFIGSLIEGKGIFSLLEAFKFAFKNKKHQITLKIVGEGPLEYKIREFIEKHKLNSKIKILGPIYDEKKLCNIFSKAIFSISPNQAGLSVLKSFGYGVPFVTKTNSITGGERLNILNGINGILYGTQEDLNFLMSNIEENIDHFFEMGLNAYRYYYNHTTINKMSEGFIKAIEYSLK